MSERPVVYTMWSMSQDEFEEKLRELLVDVEDSPRLASSGLVMNGGGDLVWWAVVTGIEEQD